jgi:hypothetical protein
MTPRVRFIQPDIWLRVAVNASLLVGVWWTRRPATEQSPTFRMQPSTR